jgi:membrane protease YdiL (CAAX protease family)
VSTDAPSQGSEERPPWRPWTAPAALLLALAVALMLGSIAYVVAAIVTGHARSSQGGNIAATVLGDVAFVGSALFFAQLAARPSPEQFGLRSVSLRTAMVWMVASYGAFLLFAGVWLSALGIDTKDTSIQDITKTTPAIVCAAILVTVIAPVAEEVLFRGYIFTALRGWAGVWGAAAIDGILFGAIHLDPNRPVGFLVPLAFFGFVLCLLYRKTGSLLPCIALHSINNALAFGSTEGWPAWAMALLAVGALAVLGLVLVPLGRLTGGGPRLRPA